MSVDVKKDLGNVFSFFKSVLDLLILERRSLRLRNWKKYFRILSEIEESPD